MLFPAKHDLSILFESRFGRSVMGLKPVLRIHKIFIRIRIQSRGSKPLWLMDPDPAIFVSDLQFKTSTTKKNFKLFLLITFWRYKKVIKKSQSSRNQCFSYYFCLMIEGSGSESLSLNNGSGSGRLKNIWILRIRICNTVEKRIRFKKASRFFF